MTTIQEAEERSAVILEAFTWEGTPYHHNQALKGVAVDCARFINEPYLALGFAPKTGPSGDYSPEWHLHRSDEILLGYIEEHMTEVSDPLSADVVIFRLGRCFSHCAIVVDWPLIIHAWKDSGCVLQDDVSKMPSLLCLKDGRDRPRRFYRLKRWC